MTAFIWQGNNLGQWIVDPGTPFEYRFAAEDLHNSKTDVLLTVTFPKDNFLNSLTAVAFQQATGPGALRRGIHVAVPLAHASIFPFGRQVVVSEHRSESAGITKLTIDVYQNEKPLPGTYQALLNAGDPGELIGLIVDV